MTLILINQFVHSPLGLLLKGGGRKLYLGRSFHEDIPFFPPDLLTRIFRTSGELVVEPSNEVLRGVTTSWHHNLVDVRSLASENPLSARVRVVKYNSKSVIAKIAQFEFEFEIPQIETEIALYQVIDGQGIGPAFLGHLVEHGRVMGFLIERIEGCHGEIDDIEACQSVFIHWRLSMET
jgi:hypothetical protein